MFCSVCREAAAADAVVSHKNSFTSGNCQFKLESIKLHEESRNHKSVKANCSCQKPSMRNTSHKILNKRKSRATSVWDGPLRIQANWPDRPTSAGVNF